MPIKHPTIKVPGNTLAAIADWNANHTIDPGTILRSATLIVAASDSLDTTNADYFCDGVADEVQINQAISDLPATGGSVLLMDGTYDIDATININKSYVDLMGQGRSTRIISDDVLGEMIDVTVDFCSVRNLSLKSSTAAQGIDMSSKDGIIYGCWFEDITDGIRTVDDYIVISTCVFNACGDGIYAAGRYGAISNCVFYDGGIGIKAYTTYGTISNCFFESQSTGIDCNQNYWTISNISGYNCNRLIYLSGEYNSISNCAGRSNDVTVEMYGASNNSISNCTSNNCTKSLIEVRGGSHNNSIINNSAYDVTGTYGIKVEDSNYNLINGNALTKVDQDGIWVHGSSHNVISDNNIHDCSEDADDTYSGIFLTDTSTYNVVSNNRVSADAANKHQYGIRENAAADDWNLIHGNICTDAVTANISSQGVNSVVADNIAP